MTTPAEYAAGCAMVDQLFAIASAQLATRPLESDVVAQFSAAIRAAERSPERLAVILAVAIVRGARRGAP